MCTEVSSPCHVHGLCCKSLLPLTTLLIGQIALLVCYICWTAALAMAQEGNKSKKRNQAAEIATIAIIYMYHPCYNIGYNALSYTYLIEVSTASWR